MRCKSRVQSLPARRRIMMAAGVGARVAQKVTPCWRRVHAAAGLAATSSTGVLPAATSLQQHDHRDPCQQQRHQATCSTSAAALRAAAAPLQLLHRLPWQQPQPQSQPQQSFWPRALVLQRRQPADKAAGRPHHTQGLAAPAWCSCSHQALTASTLASGGSTSSGSCLYSSSSSSNSRHRRQGPPLPAATVSSTSVRSANGSSSNHESSSSSSPPPLPGAQEISSAANPYIKHCIRLREKARYRQQQRRLLLVGATLLAEVAAEAAGSLDVLVLFVRPGASPPPSVSAQRVITVTDAVMKKLTGLEEPAGVTVVAELALPAYHDLAAWPSQDQAMPAAGAAPGASQQRRQLQRLLVLEGVQDPGNVGTLLRCSMAFGWDAVWLLPGCADPFGDKVLRASRGASLRCPLAAGSLEQLLELVQRRGMLLLAAEPEDQQQHGAPGTDLLGSSGTGHAGVGQRLVCLVLGTEGAGLSQQVLAAATPLAVPMPGSMESLNVGVAGAILMFALSSGGLQQLSGRLAQLQLLQAQHATAG